MLLENKVAVVTGVVRSVGDMATMIANGGWSAPEVASVGKPAFHGQLVKVVRHGKRSSGRSWRAGSAPVPDLPQRGRGCHGTHQHVRRKALDLFARAQYTFCAVSFD